MNPDNTKAARMPPVNVGVIRHLLVTANTENRFALSVRFDRRRAVALRWRYQDDVSWNTALFPMPPSTEHDLAVALPPGRNKRAIRYYVYDPFAGTGLHPAYRSEERGIQGLHNF